MRFPSVQAAPFVPDRGPERASTRAEINARKRRLEAGRVRVRNRVAAAEIEAPSAVFGRQWRASLLNAERHALARAREAEIWREVAAERAQEDFGERRAAFRLALEREQFYRAWRDPLGAARELSQRTADEHTSYRGRETGRGADIRRWAGQDVALMPGECSYAHPHSGPCQPKRI